MADSSFKSMAFSAEVPLAMLYARRAAGAKRSRFA